MARKLTDKRIKALKATGKQYKIFDGDGLYIHITDKGSKLWRMSYRFEGKQKLMSFGSYPEVSLESARNQCSDARKLLASNIDPNAEKNRIKQIEKKESESATRTFRVVALEWMEIEKEKLASTTFKKKMRLLEKLFSGIGNKPITEIVPTDILAVIRPIEACEKNETAHALAQNASQVFTYARTCGYCLFNAADNLSKVLKPCKVRHLPCITDEKKIGILLRNIDEYSGSISVMWALRILPYVAVRSTELRGAKWNEFDFDKTLWIIPATRAKNEKDGGGMKTRIAHTISLSQQVVTLFMQLKEHNGQYELCFPGMKSNNKCITDNGLLLPLRVMGYTKDEMCIHGFRGMFSTLLNTKKLEWGFDSDIIAYAY